uniref:Palmitoyltransferase n=1 Tax=Plectus sambesii TaxID=2011161 RepID=A0A914W5Q6_9BILA
MTDAKFGVLDAPKWPAFKPDRPQPPLRPLWRRLLHWGPILAITVTLQIGMSALYVHQQWWPLTTVAAWLHITVFLIWNYLTLTNLCSAAYVGPGYVPLGWRPPTAADEAKLQWCGVCEGFKAPRSHHCRKCNRCTMKMDHHCPWVNNCTGHKNHAYFVRFLASAVVGCTHAAIILGASIYRAIFRVWYLYYGTGKEPIVELGLYGLISTIFAFGLAIGVIFSVGFLLYVQLKSIYRNRTGIEDYIMDKVDCRERTDTFVYPYSLGWRRNAAEVLGTWSGQPKGDGMWWPVVDTCDQFTLTLEQIAQKESKRQRSRVYVIVRDYSGRICTLWHGVPTLCCQPFSDEARIVVKPGQHYMITRATKYWLYGDLLIPGGSPDAPEPSEASAKVLHGADIGSNRHRGWFPRSCARRVSDVVVTRPKEPKKLR